MANATAQPFNDDMQTLFSVGTSAGLTDGQLLERFIAGRDEAGELAFEALVAHHGPMVMRVCRNVLDDPHDVHDAFQAVFLVLARRAHAIRDRQSVACWLYGVAVRVSARARVVAIKRQIRDRRTSAAAQTIATAAPTSRNASAAERTDQAEVVHQELSRLPEKYRAPVVLCYLEGLTHDEAAAQLRWPVGTVRSRLARARDRLRSRLSRRGVTTPIAVGPLVSWVASDSPAPGAAIAHCSAETISRELAASIARSVSHVPVGRTSAAIGGSSASLGLAQGVYQAMMFKKLLLATCAFVPVTITLLGGALFVAGGTQAQTQKPPAAAADPVAARKDGAESPPREEIDRLARQLLEAARSRYDAQRAYYEEGRITIDRFVDASKQLALAELRLAGTDADRLEARQRHVDRIKKIESRERAELEIGRGTIADVTEAHERRLEAELDLKLDQHQAGEMSALLRRLNALERKVDQLQKERARK